MEIMELLDENLSDDVQVRCDKYRDGTFIVTA